MPCYHPLISIHVPREGDDPTCGAGKSARTNFNPRPPRGGRPWQPVLYAHVSDISIHVPREGDDFRGCQVACLAGISIHVPREGDDYLATTNGAPPLHFNPRPPRGGRPGTQYFTPMYPIFQSTSPARGTTQALHTDNTGSRFQSTSPARGTTREPRQIWYWYWYFNPRPPRGGRLPVADGIQPLFHFNPRPPRGGRRRVLITTGPSLHFNPRPPRGGRPPVSLEDIMTVIFQSTSPARGTTQARFFAASCALFQSTSPARGTTAHTISGLGRRGISIHVPREGDDRT